MNGQIGRRRTKREYYRRYPEKRVSKRKAYPTMAKATARSRRMKTEKRPLVDRAIKRPLVTLEKAILVK